MLLGLVDPLLLELALLEWLETVLEELEPEPEVAALGRHCE